ncbi:hypothetical protein C8Q75DRAFT_732208 [Abortiporus biennis]|nr:hypothetical protein C8Q75DRAFT_732208 [Abortiporus biennis]
MYRLSVDIPSSSLGINYDEVFKLQYSDSVYPSIYNESSSLLWNTDVQASGDSDSGLDGTMDSLEFNTLSSEIDSLTSSESNLSGSDCDDSDDSDIDIFTSTNTNTTSSENALTQVFSFTNLKETLEADDITIVDPNLNNGIHYGIAQLLNTQDDEIITSYGRPSYPYHSTKSQSQVQFKFNTGTPTLNHTISNHFDSMIGWPIDSTSSSSRSSSPDNDSVGSSYLGWNSSSYLNYRDINISKSSSSSSGIPPRSQRMYTGRLQHLRTPSPPSLGLDA